ncbi:MAG: adenylate/guanylate cyclase domain-containing protein [Spirochaetales bacterium]|nr:adenylate/guanylate cyclase domain-containing protein [Spirochaetales bacterium]
MAVKRLIPIKMTIISSFFLTLFLVVFLLTAFTYFINSRSALSTAEHLMESTSSQILLKIENMYEPMAYLVNQAGSLPSVAAKPTLQTHPAEAYMLNAMGMYKQVQIQYIGFQDGDFFCIYSLSAGYQGERENTHAPQSAAFAVLRQYTPPGQDKPVRLWRYLNESGQTIGSFKEKGVSYDPRERGWYKSAVEEEGVSKSLPYIFDNSGEPGITVSVPIEGAVPGVYGVDILLSEISDYLEQMRSSRNSRIVLFNEDLQIIASARSADQFSGDRHPLMVNSHDPLVAQIAAILERDGLEDRNTLTVEVDNVPYLVKIMAAADQFNSKEYILLGMSKNEILGPLAYESLMNLFYALLLFVLSVPLIIYIASRISLPIKDLAREANIIAKRDFQEDIEISTGIKEINDLTEEMAVMKRGLRHFNKYVPSRLVTHLLEDNRDITIGGDNREVTVMFTDIADFTGISENCPPQTLMEELSVYFHKSTDIIRRNNGLVDKYIGDAVMAIWNAPQQDPDHIRNACRAALELKKELNAFADEQEIRKKLVFRTRIGLDTGLAVVGNVGSMDRMNYTVIGDIVNNASRLEGVNKLYGTEILISEHLARHVEEDFILRPVAKVIVKGKTREQLIYELIDERELAEPEVIEQIEVFELGFNLFHDRKWDDAILAFQKSFEIRESSQSRSYIEECQRMMQNPPGKDWSGIRVLREK